MSFSANQVQGLNSLITGQVSIKNTLDPFDGQTWQCDLSAMEKEYVGLWSTI